MSDKNENKELENDLNNNTDDVESEENRETQNSASETEALINKIVEERIAKAKAAIDKAYKERDEAVKKAVALEEERKAAKIAALESEGKHQEVAKMKIAELEEKLRLATEKNVQLTRDATVREALTGLDFRNEKSQQMAYRDIVDQLVQDEDTGAWVHRSGVSIKEFVSAFSKDENNSFLFRPKTNSGSGVGGINSTGQKLNKKISEMTTEEILQAAASGKLGSFNV